MPLDRVNARTGNTLLWPLLANRRHRPILIPPFAIAPDIRFGATLGPGRPWLAWIAGALALLLALAALGSGTATAQSPAIEVSIANAEPVTEGSTAEFPVTLSHTSDQEIRIGYVAAEQAVSTSPTSHRPCGLGEPR